jgi:hypothetical protein
MAVDIKQLRIGSHVEVNGVRARVIELVEKHLENQPWAMLGATICGGYQTCGVFLQGAEPISITPELLVELGFVKRNRYDNNKAYYIDAASAERMENNRLVIPQIELLDYSEIGNPELWEVKILSTDKGFTVEHKTTVCFLHEFEAFTYITLGKELIKE